MGAMVRRGHIIKDSIWHAKELGLYPGGKEKSIEDSKEECDKIKYSFQLREEYSFILGHFILKRNLV